MKSGLTLKYGISVEKIAGRVTALAAGQTVAESDNVLVMHKTRRPSSCYFPRDAVREGLLEPSDLKTFGALTLDAAQKRRLSSATSA